MIAAVSDLASRWLDTYLLNAQGVKNFGFPVVVLTVTLMLEYASRRNLRQRYFSRHFGVDMLYFAFYYGGFYHLLIFSWIFLTLQGLLATHAPWLRMDLLAGAPVLVQLLVLLLVADFVGYWGHRLRHTSLLWPFHAIHHSQTNLTVATNYRYHVVDETVMRLCVFLPFQVLGATVLGASVGVWIAVDFAMAWVLLLQHSEWDWTYGRFGRVVISPAFHRKHHALDGHHNRNFGLLFSFWDDLFGTSDRRVVNPSAHGLPGDPVPDTLWGQFVYPFGELTRSWRTPRESALNETAASSLVEK